MCMTGPKTSSPKNCWTLGYVCIPDFPTPPSPMTTILYTLTPFLVVAKWLIRAFSASISSSLPFLFVSCLLDLCLFFLCPLELGVTCPAIFARQILEDTPHKLRFCTNFHSHFPRLLFVPTYPIEFSIFQQAEVHI